MTVIQKGAIPPSPLPGYILDRPGPIEIQSLTPPYYFRVLFQSRMFLVHENYSSRSAELEVGGEGADFTHSLEDRLPLLRC